MQFIRQNATHKICIGPAVAVGDGFTPVTTLAVSSADEAEVILHDNGTVVSISGYTWAAITTADGYYHLTLQSGISGTVGHMTVVINDDSLILPIKAEFTVIEEAVYDNLFAAAAVGPLSASSDGSGLTEAGGTGDHLTAINLPNQTMDIVGNITGNLSGSVGSVTGAVGSVTGAVGSVTAGVTLATDAVDADALAADAVAEIQSGLGTAANQATIIGFIDTEIGAIDGKIDGIKAVTDLLPDAGALTSIVTAIADVPTVAEFEARTLIAASYFDPATDTVAHVTLVDTTTTNSDMRGTDSAATAAALASLVTTVGVAGVGLTDLGGMSTGMKAEVNAEVVDVLTVDTFAQPGQGAPPATASFLQMLGYQFKAWRNKSTQDATTYELYNDDTTTVDQKAACSDDGTDFERGEITTGP